MTGTMAEESSAERAPTGVPGLDDILSGGLPRGHLYLLEGEPGAGKTTLALQFLLDGVERGESVLYITLSETAEELRLAARSHGWDLSAVELMELGSFLDGQGLGKPYTVFSASEVELGDTLSKIAQRAHVSWHSLYVQNKKVVGSNPNLIFPGQKLDLR